MKAVQWIDRARALNGWPSDYRAAAELNLSRSALSIYRNKPTATLDEDVAVRVAHACGVRPALVIVDQLAERTKSDAARRALRGLLQHCKAPH